MKKSVLYTLLVLMLNACNNQNTKTNTDKNVAFIHQYFEYFNQHNWNKLSAMYIDSAEFKDPSIGIEIVKQNHQQFIKKYTELQQIFPNIKDDIEHIYSSGEKHVIVEFISSGTAADKSTFKLPICTIFTIENGFITKDFTYYDNFNE